MTMKVELDEEKLRTVLDSAIITALGETGKDAIIKEVVKYLTTEPTSWKQGQSPLWTALRTSADQAARRYFDEKIATDPEFKKAIDAVYTEAFKMFFDTDFRHRMASEMAQTLSGAFTERKRNY